MTGTTVNVERCRCGHWRQLHTPTGRTDNTSERGHGPCTAGVFGHQCICNDYTEDKR